MALAFFEFLLWLQPAATPSASSGGGASGGGGGGGGLFTGPGMLTMLGVLAITYFFILRPEAARRKETEDMQKGLRKGMKVRTTGGILGEIISMDDRSVMLAIADKVRINVLKSDIRGPEVEAAPAAEPAKTEPKKEEAK